MTTESNRELIAMLEGGPDMTLADVIGFVEQFLKRPLTEVEIQEVKAELLDMPE